MSVNDLVRNALHEAADRPVEDDALDELERELTRDLEHHDHMRIAARVIGSVFAFLVALVIALGTRSGSTHQHVKIDHPKTVPTSTVPALHTRHSTPPPHTSRIAKPRSHVIAQPAHIVPATLAPAPHASTPPSTTPSQVATTPVVAPPDSSFWAMAQEVRDNNDNPMIVVFGAAPASKTVTVDGPYGSRQWTVPATGEFSWKIKLDNNTPATPMQFTVHCDGCGDTTVSLDHFDPAPTQPAPNSGFSAFVVPDGTNFVIGGFVPLAHVSSVTLSSPYGNATFDNRNGIWGGRIAFPTAPLNAPFSVVFSAPGAESVTLRVTRTH